MSSSNSDNMRVINRHGKTEEISFDEIKYRINELINFTDDYVKDPLSYVSATKVTVETVPKLHDGITTRELDTESDKVCASLEFVHYNYGILGGRILASDQYKHLKTLSLETFSQRTEYINSKLVNFYNESYINFVESNKDILNSIIKLSRNYLLTYFAFKTLEKSYLIKVGSDPIETPQDVFLRVAIAIHHRTITNISIEEKINYIKETYDLISLGYFTHATPTLFNAGTNHEQLSSCYLLGTEDSLNGIFKTISDVANISKWAGGIGLHISNIRGSGSLIHSTNGLSNGIIPMLKVYNEVGRFIDQGGKRKGSIAIYLEPWHSDIESFLELKLPTGAETERARDLFLALWIPDEFMRRLQSNVEEDKYWYLMCPSESPGLADLYDDNDNKEFTTLYTKYIAEGKYVKKVDIKELFNKIIVSQIETGVPYILFKDNINRKSNQSNIGIVKSSNLCCEITEVSNADEYSVCNLGSIAVNKFVKLDELTKHNLDTFFEPYHNLNQIGQLDKIEQIEQLELYKIELLVLLESLYDFASLAKISSVLTYNLNNIIDYNFYPVPETAKSNFKNRPIGIGIQGLGDLYYMLNLPYSSYVAKYIDALIMETIYHSAISTSSDIAKDRSSYERFNGSAFSNGIFQFDMWLVEGRFDYTKLYPQRMDWDNLKTKVLEQGMANSLLTALMPTASTSQILGNNECFEPYSSNIYKRTTLAGQFKVVNKHLVDKLMNHNLWTETIRNKIILTDGSIKNLSFDDIPNFDTKILKDVYKTIWEVKQKDVIDHALARSPYIDQSQSMNLFFAEPNSKNLFSALIYGWKNGIKTGCYYLRSLPAIEAIKYTSNTNTNSSTNTTHTECTTCSA